MKKILSAISLFFLCLASSFAQTKWVRPADEGAFVHGQGWEELRSGYVRLPSNAAKTVRPAVWGLSRNSAGLSLVFSTEARNILVRYKVTGGISLPHMPATGVSGVDMYMVDGKGDWLWCAPVFNFNEDPVCLYTYTELAGDGKTPREFHLFMPLYNTVEWLEIGIPEKCEISFAPVSGEKPVVVYGTSIAQGACASRPGMAWTNIVSRDLNYPVVNLGFSGNAIMETALFELMSEIDAAAYVIDCLPNMGNRTGVIDSLLVNGIGILRRSHDCPILIVEHCGNTGGQASPGKAKYYLKTNEGQKAGYKHAREAGFKGLYYLTTEEIGFGMDDMVEGIHPTDAGMRCYSDAIGGKLRKMLHLRRK